jgi:hypothetical protein
MAMRNYKKYVADYRRYATYAEDAWTTYQDVHKEYRRLTKEQREFKRIDEETQGMLSQGWKAIPKAAKQPTINDVARPSLWDTRVGSAPAVSAFVFIACAVLMSVFGVVSPILYVLAFMLAVAIFFKGIAINRNIDAKKAYRQLLDEFKNSKQDARYSAYTGRTHGKAIPDGAHHKYAAFADLKTDQLQLLEFTSEAGHLLYRVVQEEPLSDEVDEATTQALHMSQQAEERELQAWQEQVATSAEQDIVNEITQQKLYERKQALGHALGQDMTLE